LTISIFELVNNVLLFVTLFVTIFSKIAGQRISSWTALRSCY